MDREGEADLASAEGLLTLSVVHPENVGFFAQQAVEKWLKALLAWHDVSFPRTHDLSVLRGLLFSVEADLADQLAFAEHLTPLGTEFRYPGDYNPLDLEDARQAVSVAQRVRALIAPALEQHLRT